MRSATRTASAIGAANGAGPEGEKARAKAKISEAKVNNDMQTDTVAGVVAIGTRRTGIGLQKMERWAQLPMRTLKRQKLLLGTRRIVGTVLGVVAAGRAEAIVGGSRLHGAAGTAGQVHPGTSRTGIHKVGRATRSKTGTETPTKVAGGLPKMSGRRRRIVGVTKSGRQHLHKIRRRQAGRSKMPHNKHTKLTCMVCRCRLLHRLHRPHRPLLL